MSEDRSDWGREFEEPIALPDGRKLIVLRDAASYITALPKKESDAPEWQAAIEALMLVAQLGGPTMFARNRHDAGDKSSPCSRVHTSSKGHHSGRRKLKRDQ